MAHETLKLPVSPRHRATQTIRKWIKDGVLDPGQALPSERVLAERVGVSRTTLRSSLIDLQKDGWVGGGENGRVRIVRREQAPVVVAAEASGRGVLAGAIAVLTPDGTLDVRHTQPGWVEHLIQGSVKAVRSAGRSVLIVHPDQLKGSGLQQLVAAVPYGVVVPETAANVGFPAPETLRQLTAAGIPIVVYGSGVELAPFDRVMSDHEAGSYEITRWMIAHGRKRVLNVWRKPGDVYWCQNRRRGYERAMAEAGLEPLATHLYTHFDAMSDVSPEEQFDIRVHYFAGHIAPVLLASEPADALLLFNDGEVAVAAAACRLLGKEPGRDVLLAGYDNFWAGTPEHERVSTPPSVTVDKRNADMGAEMVRLLIDRVDGRLPAGPQVRVVTPQLVVVEEPDSTPEQITGRPGGTA